MLFVMTFILNVVAQLHRAAASARSTSDGQSPSCPIGSSIARGATGAVARRQALSRASRYVLLAAPRSSASLVAARPRDRHVIDRWSPPRLGLPHELPVPLRREGGPAFVDHRHGLGAWRRPSSSPFRSRSAPRSGSKSSRRGTDSSNLRASSTSRTSPACPASSTASSVSRSSSALMRSALPALGPSSPARSPSPS